MTGNGFSVNPIDFLMIESWERASLVPLTFSEKRLIIDLGQIYLRVIHKKKSRVDKTPRYTDGAGVMSLMRGKGAKRVKKDGPGDTRD